MQRARASNSSLKDVLLAAFNLNRLLSARLNPVRRAQAILGRAFRGSADRQLLDCRRHYQLHEAASLTGSTFAKCSGTSVDNSNFAHSASVLMNDPVAKMSSISYPSLRVLDWISECAVLVVKTLRSLCPYTSYTLNPFPFKRTLKEPLQTVLVAPVPPLGS